MGLFWIVGIGRLRRMRKLNFGHETVFPWGRKPNSAAGKSVSGETEFRGGALSILFEKLRCGHTPCNSLQKEGNIWSCGASNFLPLSN